MNRDTQIILETQQWLEDVVIGLNLFPFYSHTGAWE